jgi:DNA-binding LacI/PurR family transcriptional regulator
MVRLKDIAARAGVSVMTVSKVMRDARDISAGTKARIRLLAQEMGYVPDALAQGLRTRRTRLLGLVISTATNPIFARIILAIEERVHALGYDLIVAHTLNDPEREEVCIRRLISRRVDGIFIYPVYRLSPTAPVYEELRRRRLPAVILGHLAPFCQGFANVETDDEGAAYLVTRHLLSLGHRQIAFLTGPAAAPWARERFEGYRRALRESRVELDDRLIFQSGRLIEDGDRAAQAILRERPSLTAVQAVNDLVAMGAATTLLDSGLRIPQDLSVTGFGNVLTSQYFRVPLTTVRQPKFRQGTAAMDSMMQLLGQEQPPPKRLMGELVVRRSTAPPGTSPPGPSSWLRTGAAASAASRLSEIDPVPPPINPEIAL